MASSTLRGRQWGYDNLTINPGSIVGIERTILGSAPPLQVNGGGSNLAVGVAHPTANISDNQVIGAPTMARERLGP